MFSYLIILLSIFLTLYDFPIGSRHVTYGDILSLIIVCVFIKNLFNKFYIINKYAKLNMLYLIILFLSALANHTLLEGSFTNIFKIGTVCVIYFIIIYTLIIKRKLSISSFVWGMIILSIVYLFKTWKEIQTGWADGFILANIFDSGLNRNTWGFNLVLFLIITLYACIKKIYFNTNTIYSLILICFIFFSYSRSSYILAGLILFVYFYQMKNFKMLFLTSFVVIIFTIANNYWRLFNFSFDNHANEFIVRKMDTLGNDLINVRFHDINLAPIVHYFGKFNLINFLIGDGLSPQHSFVSHTLIMTGIVGFFCYIWIYIYGLRNGISVMKNTSRKQEAVFLLLTLCIIIINNFNTNVSTFFSITAYLGTVILAFFFATINKNDRIC